MLSSVMLGSLLSEAVWLCGLWSGVERSLAGEPAGDGLQVVPDGAVEDLVADAHLDPADDGRVDRDLQLDGPAVEPAQRGGEPLLLLGGERRGDADLGDVALPPAGGELREVVEGV